MRSTCPRDGLFKRLESADGGFGYLGHGGGALPQPCRSIIGPPLFATICNLYIQYSRLAVLVKRDKNMQHARWRIVIYSKLILREMDCSRNRE
jgi:hypothetical protein